MARSPSPTPRTLYPDWPTEPVPDPDHEKIRQAMVKAAELVHERYSSVREAARKFNMNHTVLNAALTGRSWPSMATLARMENGLDSSLWSYHDSDGE